MSHSRGPKGAGHKREPGGFLAIPMAFLRSDISMRLSRPALKLLLDLGAQYNLENNGRLIASFKKLQPRGWKSEETLFKARRELEALQLIMETRKGGRPNRASWYALTFFNLDPHPGYDIAPTSFVRGAWRLVDRAVITPLDEAVAEP